VTVIVAVPRPTAATVSIDVPEMPAVATLASLEVALKANASPSGSLKISVNSIW